MRRLQSAEHMPVEEEHEHVYEVGPHVAHENYTEEFVKPNQDVGALDTRGRVPEVQPQNARSWPHLRIYQGQTLQSGVRPENVLFVDEESGQGYQRVYPDEHMEDHLVRYVQSPVEV